MYLTKQMDFNRLVSVANLDSLESQSFSCYAVFPGEGKNTPLFLNQQLHYGRALEVIVKKVLSHQV